jgi:nitrous oxidase accessory protein NosD
MRNIISRALALVISLCVVVHATSGSTRVKAGHSIQSAIDAAKPGDRIVVEAGEYHEQLTISKNGLQLVAKKGVILLPPLSTSPGSSGCAGLAGENTVAGICIIGTDVQLEPFEKDHRKVISVGSYVDKVLVQGFDIRGFFGLNIAVVGAQHAEVRGNSVSDGSSYGILTVGSIHTLITRNTVKSSSLMFIGICMDDRSDVLVTQNRISDYGIGLCIQTNGADVRHNKVTNCCVGAFVDPLVDGARLTHNKFGPSNAACTPLNGVTAAGIAIGGALNTEVHRNEVTGINNAGNANSTAPGLLIYDDALSPATNNHITFNKFTNNDPDIAVFSTGNNEIKKNKCDTPDDLCSQQ